MNERYIVTDELDGYALLMDTTTGRLVRTGSGDVYTAPIENVRWTAVTMNKRLADVEPTPVLADPTSESTKELFEGAEIVDTGATPVTPKKTPEPTPVASLETRLESCASLETRLGTPMTDSKPRRYAEDFLSAQSWRVGAYGAAVRSAEREVRAARDMVYNGNLSVPRLMAMLDSAVRALESGRASAENDNPYA